jgi:peptidoglycan-associated lipoprotein
VTVTTPPPPPPPPPPKVSDEEQFNAAIKDAFFDFDKSDVRPDAQQALTADADFLKAHPDIKFTIEGHCDERGSEEYNLGLGDRRANSAKSFLTNLGVSADRITTISYGKDRPVCTEHNEECWQRNRRAHLVYGTQTKQ